MFTLAATVMPPRDSGPQSEEMGTSENEGKFKALGRNLIESMNMTKKILTRE
jgi:hypothetical protein